MWTHAGYNAVLPYMRSLLGVLGHISPNDVIYRSNPQKAPPCADTSMEPPSVKIGPMVRPGRVPEEKRTVQYRTGRGRQKKSKSRYISPTWGEAPLNRFAPKFAQYFAVRA